jgi:hypothetical protein
VRSCGCLFVKHGMARSREYKIWVGMIQRCTNPNRTEWNYYGGRGIKVCDRWLSFENFLCDMGLSNGLTIERKDNDGNYEPSNCIWETRKEHIWCKGN